MGEKEKRQDKKKREEKPPASAMWLRWGKSCAGTTLSHGSRKQQTVRTDCGSSTTTSRFGYESSHPWFPRKQSYLSILTICISWAVVHVLRFFFVMHLSAWSYPVFLPSHQPTPLVLTRSRKIECETLGQLQLHIRSTTPWIMTIQYINSWNIQKCTA